MAETLLRTNRRAAAVFSALAAVILLAGILLAAWGAQSQRSIVTWIGVLLALVGAWRLWKPLVMLVRPRLAITQRDLLVYLRGLFPWRVPLEAVECFFIGQAPSPVRVRHPSGGRVETVTVVVRLAQKAQAWHERPIDPKQGKWKEGYITIFGTWCEPLDGDVVNGMNHRLAEIKRAHRAAAARSMTE